MVNQQSFAANPRTVNPGPADKYRDGEDDEYFANIHFDKRVHRGSNYSRSTVPSDADRTTVRVVKVGRPRRLRQYGVRVVDPHLPSTGGGWGRPRCVVPERGPRSLP